MPLSIGMFVEWTTPSGYSGCGFIQCIFKLCLVVCGVNGEEYIPLTWLKFDPIHLGM